MNISFRFQKHCEYLNKNFLWELFTKPAYSLSVSNAEGEVGGLLFSYITINHLKKKRYTRDALSSCKSAREEAFENEFAMKRNNINYLSKIHKFISNTRWDEKREKFKFPFSFSSKKAWNFCFHFFFEINKIV
jgi:hypothetical protein